MEIKTHPETTYHTTAINEAGMEGVAYIVNEDSYRLSSPNNDLPGTNPEQLLGLALATCLNATLEAIEKRNGYPHSSKVRVDVYQAADVRGLKFLVDVSVYIPLSEEITLRNAEAMFNLAESRCPVAKLLGHSEGVTFQLVHDWD